MRGEGTDGAAGVPPTGEGEAAAERTGAVRGRGDGDGAGAAAARTEADHTAADRDGTGLDGTDREGPDREGPHRPDREGPHRDGTDHDGADRGGPVRARAVLDRPGLTAGEAEILRVLGRAQDLGSVGSQIVVSLGASIIEGRLRPGDDLNSVELARRFHSSRTPVREALAVLEREGLVEIAARKRPRVRTLGIAEVREIYELRAELYGLVSRRIVRHCTDGQLDDLRAAQADLDAAAAAEDLERFFWLVVGFRNTEARLAANETVRGVLDSVGIRTLQLRHLSLSLPGRVETSVADHRRLLKAYVDRDADLAAALTRSIVRRGLAAVEGSGWNGFAG